jgi:hypothetical protein
LTDFELYMMTSRGGAFFRGVSGGLGLRNPEVEKSYKANPAESITQLEKFDKAADSSMLKRLQGLVASTGS